MTESQAKNLFKTPLYQSHVNAGALMVDFGGWNLPLHYGSILEEYHHTRNEVSLFDVCHMGEFIFVGDLEESGLDELVTMPLKDMEVKTSRYGFLLNEEAGIIDDLIVFRTKPKEWLMVVNAACIDQDKKHIRQHITHQKAFVNVSKKIGKIDIQGPKALDVFSQIIPGIADLKYFTFDFFDVLGENILISRTGYTGELGYEIFLPANKTQQLWEMILDFDEVRPAGLGARDILRMEVGYCLYGQDLDIETTPLDAGMSRFLCRQKNFIGREKLLEKKAQGCHKKLVGICSDTRKAPRHGHQVFSSAGDVIGTITSGTYSPAISKGIGFCYVDKSHAELNTQVLFGNDKSKTAGQIVSKRFFTSASLKV